MLRIILALLPVFTVLLVSELLWRGKHVKGERARKFIHILSGVWIAFWPFYLPFDGIFILGFLALTLLIYSRVTNLFHAIYAVKRRTYGEIFFAIAIILCAYIAQEPWIFTLSMLFLAMADGGAAIVGRFWGITNQYLVFGQPNLRKSVAGTAAFLVLAYVSVLVGWLIGGGDVLADHLLVALLVLPLGATILENVAPFGTDNLFTPLYATLLLNSLL